MCLIMDNRAPEGTAKLVAFDHVLRCRRGKEVLRVEDRVADKFKYITVEIIGPRFSNYVNHATGIFPILRAVVGGLHAEFLKRIGEGKWLVDIGVLVYVVAAIKLITDSILSRTIDGIRYGAGERLGGSLVSAAVRRVDSTGYKQRKCRCVASVQGQLRDAFLLDDLFNGRG